MAPKSPYKNHLSEGLSNEDNQVIKNGGNYFSLNKEQYEQLLRAPELK